VRIDTGYLRNPKIVGLNQSAILLHLAGILWTADQLTDGWIPSAASRELAAAARIDHRQVRARIDQLIDAGLWRPNGDGWLIHDFDAMNPQAMRHRVEAQRKRWRERQANWRG